ncbi:MAG: glycosyltransferase family 9 protein [Colwellia sp.]|jgi:ADP-heptose:LPS heptosyltransferase
MNNENLNGSASNKIVKYIKRKISMFVFDKEKKAGIILPVHHVLFINWHGKIGDAIVSSFLFKELRKIEGIKISVITTEEIESLYSKYYKVDDVHILKEYTYKAINNIANDIKEVDTIVPLMGRLSMKDLFLIYKIDPNNLFGIDDELSRSNLQMGKRTKRSSIHDIFKLVLEDLNIKHIEDDYIVPTGEGASNIDKYDIVFNPFASRVDKCLSVDKSVSTLLMISSFYPSLSIGVLCSSVTKEIACKIISKLDNENISAIRNTNTLYDAIDTINAAGLIITVDTSIGHIASGLNKKLIAIYYKAGDTFNQWLIQEKVNSKVIFSEGFSSYKEKNMNNFCEVELLKSIKYLKSL